MPRTGSDAPLPDARLVDAHRLARHGNHAAAIKLYGDLCQDRPELAASLGFNIELSRRRLALAGAQAPTPSATPATPAPAAVAAQADTSGSRPAEDFRRWTPEPDRLGLRLSDDGRGFRLETSGGRRFLTRRLEVTAGHLYRLQLSTVQSSGSPGHVALVFIPGMPEPLAQLRGHGLANGGDTELVFESPQSGSALVRLGVGTSAPIGGAAGFGVEALFIEDCGPRPASQPEHGDLAKHPVDPALTLPPPAGPLNDYSEIAARAQAWATSGQKPSLKLTVVVPGFERMHLLRNTLATLCRQTYPRELLEVVLVDDGSQVGAYEQVFFEFADRLTLYLARQPHRGYGLSRARNLGARAATGDVLLFLDSDILLPDRFCAALMALHHAEPMASVLGIRRFVDSRGLEPEAILEGRQAVESLPRVRSANPHHQLTDPQTGESLDWRLPEFDRNNWLREATQPFRYFGGGHASVSRARFEQIGGFDEDFREWGNEDQEFAYRLWATGQYFVPLRDCFDLHQEEPGLQDDQGYKLTENQRTHLQLVERCPHFSVRAAGRGSRPLVPAWSVVLEGEAGLATLRSVLAQSLADLEVVCVVGHAVAAAMQGDTQADSRVRVLASVGEGRAADLARALAVCRGEHVVLPGLGATLCVDALERLDAAMRKRPSVECLLVGTAPETTAEELEEVDRHELMAWPRLPGVLVFRRGLVGRMGGWSGVPDEAVRIECLLRLSERTRPHRWRAPIESGSRRERVSEARLSDAVERHLERQGLKGYKARVLDPYRPHSLFVHRPDTWKNFSAHALQFEQPPLAPPLKLPEPRAPGNDYTWFTEEIARRYPAGAVHRYSEKVSIIVPVYNRAERLSRCLAGICLQTYPQNLIEVVITDDGSSDQVMEVVARYAQRLDLKYVKQSDLGYRLSAARNLGIRAASHRNIAIIDCDLIPLPGFIESMMRYLHHFDNVVLLGHQRFVDPTGFSDEDILRDPGVLDRMPQIRSENTTMATDQEAGFTVDWRYELYEKTEQLRHDEYPFRAFSSGHVAYRKELILRAGGYDEDFVVWGCEDNEAGYRLMLNGAYFIPLLDAIDLHQEPPSGKNETDREDHRRISRELLQRKVPATRGWFGAHFEVRPGMAPLVSICIPTHNTGAFAVEAVATALAQTEASVEVIVYDDASTDDTVALLRQAFGEDGRFRLIQGQQHRNVTWARRLLMEAARGEFIGFLDSDDLLEPSCVAECVSYLRGKPNVGLVCTGYSLIDEQGQPKGSGWKPSQFDREGLMVGNKFTHFRFMRTRDWRRSLPWTEAELEHLRYGEDWDLCLRVAEVTGFGRIEKPLYRYRLRSTSITLTSQNDFKAAQARSVAEFWLRRLGRDDLEAFSPDPVASPSRIGFRSL